MIESLSSLKFVVCDCWLCYSMNNIVHITCISHHANIMRNAYPLIPHFYVVKLGYTGVYIFFLFLFRNSGCGYSIEPPLQLSTQKQCFEQKKKKSKFYSRKRTSFLFAAECYKKLCHFAWACFRNNLPVFHVII